MNETPFEGAPDLLALDFDGVLCDGLKEYFQISWRAYCQIWNGQTEAPDGWAESFYRLRPVIETGWEMPLVLRALQLGFLEAEILDGWEAIAQSLIQQENIAPATLSTTVDSLRDEWIATDLKSWLSLHQGYSVSNDQSNTTAQRLVELSKITEVVIISTKESRFIQQLLAMQGVDFPGDRIFGKELKQPKAQTLRTVREKLAQTKNLPIVTWFVEDRMKTLGAIETHPDLADVQLFLADWGYNTAKERESAGESDRVHLLTLRQFMQDLSTWVTVP